MSMKKTLWKLPVPATAIIQGPFFKVLPRRQCEISFSIEAEDGGEKTAALLFEGVEAFKCTYLASLGSISHQLFREAYANLICLEGSPWLAEVSKARSDYHAKMPTQPKDVQHLMICFDDGPCYEIICEGFKPSQP
jgi:hypothetical protein